MKSRHRSGCCTSLAPNFSSSWFGVSARVGGRTLVTQAVWRPSCVSGAATEAAGPTELRDGGCEESLLGNGRFWSRAPDVDGPPRGVGPGAPSSSPPPTCPVTWCWSGLPGAAGLTATRRGVLGSCPHVPCAGSSGGQSASVLLATAQVPHARHPASFWKLACALWVPVYDEVEALGAPVGLPGGPSLARPPWPSCREPASHSRGLGHGQAPCRVQNVRGHPRHGFESLFLFLTGWELPVPWGLLGSALSRSPD